MHFSVLEKTGFSLMLTIAVIGGSYVIGGTLVHAEKLETPAYAVATTTEVAPAETASAPTEGEALALLASADAERGAKLFKKCKACHTTEDGGKNKVGPNLWNVVGRAKGSVGGFKYSKAITGLGGEWIYGDLDGFLASPKAFAKGTKMSFNGLKKPADRAGMILYLRSLSGSPKPLP